MKHRKGQITRNLEYKGTRRLEDKKIIRLGNKKTGKLGSRGRQNGLLPHAILAIVAKSPYQSLVQIRDRTSHFFPIYPFCWNPISSNVLLPPQAQSHECRFDSLVQSCHALMRRRPHRINSRDFDWLKLGHPPATWIGAHRPLTGKFLSESWMAGKRIPIALSCCVNWA